MSKPKNKVPPCHACRGGRYVFKGHATRSVVYAVLECIYCEKITYVEAALLNRVSFSRPIEAGAK